jgi:glycosyltransferase involved in cell wall biosynthesis
MVIMRNGIDVSRFAATPPRDPHRVIYSSSPDRGLEALLDIWPEVKRRDPLGSLHIYYGFETWTSMASGDEAQLARIAEMKATIAALSEQDVHFHGRVDQAELADSMLRSGVWAYPTWFSETSCITAMEAQAAGLHIVTSPIAALNETCPAAIMVPGEWRSSDYLEAFTYELVGAMGLAEPAIIAIGGFDWGAIALDWISLFNETPSGIMPPYRGLQR